MLNMTILICYILYIYVNLYIYIYVKHRIVFWAAPAFLVQSYTKEALRTGTWFVSEINVRLRLARALPV